MNFFFFKTPIFRETHPFIFLTLSLYIFLYLALCPSPLRLYCNLSQLMILDNLLHRLQWVLCKLADIQNISLKFLYMHEFVETSLDILLTKLYYETNKFVLRNM